jgi:hypothetical protein
MHEYCHSVWTVTPWYVLCFLQNMPYPLAPTKRLTLMITAGRVKVGVMVLPDSEVLGTAARLSAQGQIIVSGVIVPGGISN